MPRPTAPGINDQIPTRASIGEVPSPLKGMPDHVLSAAMAGLADAERRGIPVSISRYGGFRTPKMQREMYKHRNQNPNPVAAPGESQHEHGLALDAASGGGLKEQKQLAKVLEPHGWKWAGEVDPVHFDFAGNTSGAGDAPVFGHLFSPAPSPPQEPEGAPRRVTALGHLFSPATAPRQASRPQHITPQQPQQPQLRVGGRDVGAVSQFGPQQIGGLTVKAGAFPSTPQLPPGLEGLGAGATIPQRLQAGLLAVPLKVDDVAHAAANTVAKHLHAKGVAAISDPKMWDELHHNMHRATISTPGSVPLEATQELVGKGKRGYAPFPAFLADAALDFFFAPSNLIYGPAAEHTIGPLLGALGKRAAPLAERGGQAIAERAPSVARFAEGVGGYLGKGKVGGASKNVYRSLVETRARLSHETENLGRQIRNTVVEWRRNPEFDAAEEAFINKHGHNRLQELVTLYTNEPAVALRRAGEEGIDQATVKKYGETMTRQGLEAIDEMHRFGRIAGPEKGGAHYRPGSKERTEFLLGWADRVFGRKAETPSERPAAAVRAPQATPPPPPAGTSERAPGWQREPAAPTVEAAPPPVATPPAPTPAPTPPTASTEKPPWVVRAEERAKQPKPQKPPRIVPPTPSAVTEPPPAIRLAAKKMAEPTPAPSERPTPKPRPTPEETRAKEAQSIFGPGTAKPAAERGALGQRGATPKVLDPSRADVPPEVQRMVARLQNTQPEAARRLGKKWGVDQETAKKWAGLLEAPPKGFKKGAINLFASSAQSAGADPNMAKMMAVSDQAGSKEGRQALDDISRYHALETARNTGLVESLGAGEKPKPGWVQLPNKPVYGDMAGKQVPEVLGNMITGVAEKRIKLGPDDTDEIVKGGQNLLRVLVRNARLGLLHPLSNPVGLAASMFLRGQQMEIGMRRGLAQALKGKPVGEAIAGALTSGVETARLGPAGVSAAKELGGWWKNVRDSEAMQALDKWFPTWRTTFVSEGEAQRKAANLTAGGKFANVAGKRVYIPPDWARTFAESGAAAHGQMDQWAKLTLFKALRGKIGDEAAAKIVKDVLFDYSDQLPILELANRTGLWVFNAVPTKQAGLALRTLVQRPDLMARYPRLRSAFFAYQPGSKEAYENLPEYRRKYFVLPTSKDKKGVQKFTDFSRWIPFAGFFDTLNPSTKREGEDKRDLIDKALSIPLWGPAIGTMAGRNVQTGMPVTPEGAPPSRVPQDRLNAFIQEITPSSFRSAERIMRAQAGTTTSSGKWSEPQTPEEAWSQAFGFPIYKSEGEAQKRVRMRPVVSNRASNGAAFVRGLANGYSPKKNQFSGNYDSFDLNHLSALAGLHNKARVYFHQQIFDQNNYDGKGSLTEKGKQNIQEAYFRDMAMAERLHSLSQQR